MGKRTEVGQVLEGNERQGRRVEQVNEVHEQKYVKHFVFQICVQDVLYLKTILIF